jgi:nucleotide-binding universal stress UspA family protein
MYKNILIAIDGSDLSNKATAHGLALAKSIGARVTFVYVTPPWESLAFGEAAVMFPPVDYEKNMAQAAKTLLDAAAAGAAKDGVAFERLHLTDVQAYRAILDAASQKGSDLIVMGSHGRRGLVGLVLGSVTTKTVTHAKIPILVYRE